MDAKIKCQVCKISVLEKNIVKHLKKAHKSRICEECNLVIKNAHYPAHLRINHPKLFEMKKPNIFSEITTSSDKKNDSKYESRRSTKKSKKRKPKVTICKVKKMPDGLPSHSTEYGEVHRQPYSVQGGAFGLGKSRKH